MMAKSVLHQRIINQGLDEPRFETPYEVVKHFGAVQAQDYSPAKWALGLRLPHLNEADIEQAFNDGELLRTHVMRPTWHFVAPEDLGWMQRLTGPRVKRILESYHPKLQLSEKVIEKSSRVIEKALRGNHFLMRKELGAALQKEGIAASGMKLGFIVSHAELDGIICSGPRKGKQFTYALVEDRVRKPTKLTHHDALAELTKRYFTSHGPATIHDMGWWSGLTLNEVKKGIEMNAVLLKSEKVGEKTYWVSKKEKEGASISMKANLLPIYDEFYIGYKNSSKAYAEIMKQTGNTKPHLIFNNALVIGENVKGTWNKVVKKDRVEITVSLFSPLNQNEKKALEKATASYGTFLGLPVKIMK